MVFLLVFAAGSALLPKLGQEMDIPGTEYRGYQDFAQTKSVCSRKPPKIVRKGSWRWNEGEEIGIGRIFQGTDAEGNAVYVEVADVIDEKGNSRIGHYHRGGHKLVGLEKGMYLLELRASDTEHKVSVKRFALLVQG